jgi:hypothetical protein
VVYAAFTLCETVIPAQAGIQSVVTGEAADAEQHFPGFPPARE